MDYIVMDLEWNQNPYGPRGENKDIPFEIIEIGAIKLNQKLQVESSFNETIKPKVYRRIHYKIQEITSFTEEELKDSRRFKEVLRDFLEWCGDDYVFCTWGGTDLIELQRNMKYYDMERVLDFPLIFLDLQKMFSLLYEDGKSRSTLKAAVEKLEIEVDIPFHRALADAEYTAKVMKTMNFEKVKSYYSIDTFYLPRIKEEEIYATFNTYSKYISREFFSREELVKNTEVMSMKCDKCGKPLKKLINWFSDGGKTYYCAGKCAQHGYVKGKIKVRKPEETSYYAVKILKSTDKEGIQKIKEKQVAIRKKRKERRKKASELKKAKFSL